jgi:hypothetical protein
LLDKKKIEGRKYRDTFKSDKYSQAVVTGFGGIVTFVAETRGGKLLTAPET